MMARRDDAPATKADISELKDLFKGLRGEMLTKADLAGFSTKDDLANFATKDDLANFATKDDLAATTKTLALEILKTHAHIDRVDEKFSTLWTEGLSRFTKMSEDFMSQVLKVDRRQIIMDWRVDELEKRVVSLETRAP